MKANDLEEEREGIERALGERLEAHDKSRCAAQERLGEVCGGLEASTDKLESMVCSELEEKSAAESNRLQSALADLQMSGGGDCYCVKAVQRAKAELLVVQSYDVTKSNVNEERFAFDVSSLYELKTERALVSKAVETLRPTGVRATRTEEGRSLSSSPALALM